MSDPTYETPTGVGMNQGLSATGGTTTTPESSLGTATGSSFGSHRVACLFETRAAAEQAVDDLVTSGISRSAIQVVEQGPQATTATTSGGGLWESIKSLFGAGDEEVSGYYEGVNRGQVLVTVPAANEAEAERISMLLDRHNPVDIDAQETSWRESGWTGGEHTATPPGTPSPGTAAMRDVAPKPADMDDTTHNKPAARTAATSEAVLAGRAAAPAVPATTGADEVIPLVQETLAVGKRTVSRGGVRVRTYVVETPVEQDVRLRDERVQVERRPVDRAAPVGEEAFRERAIEMTETTEEAVVSKTARVTEEVTIRKESAERTEHVSDKTRRTEVEIDDDRGTPAKPGTAADPVRRD